MVWKSRQVLTSSQCLVFGKPNHATRQGDRSPCHFEKTCWPTQTLIELTIQRHAHADQTNHGLKHVVISGSKLLSQSVRENQ